MMKNLAVVVIILLVAFSKVTAQTSVPKETVATTSVKLIKTDSMFGEWTRCSFTWTEHKRISKFKFVDTEHRVTANECPRITFNADYTGYFKFADGSLKQFKWQLETNKLAILNSGFQNNGDGVVSILKDGIYKVTAHPEELRYNKIVLTDSQGVSHTLGK
ncbi:hypothetical protein JAO73_17775 [Hymenobacter sp. BT523]|uniref:hypothetical protein n=1 Tax=Hymenobacter sp. BT523 TaxID=2795725 RepID=UPI0018EC7FB2|nr:hypothetical protein [Hymenobacter sp. BT523]MBJ6110877.1 hypothetical protein [Hymenobacter sp. BT523]